MCMCACACVRACVCVLSVHIQYKYSSLLLTGKERFLILSEGCLYYFVNDKATKQKGAFSIAGYR